MQTSRRGFIGLCAALVAAPLAAMGLRKKAGSRITLEYDNKTFTGTNLKIEHVNLNGYRMYRRKGLTFSEQHEPLELAPLGENFPVHMLVPYIEWHRSESGATSTMSCSSCTYVWEPESGEWSTRLLTPEQKRMFDDGSLPRPRFMRQRHSMLSEQVWPPQPWDRKDELRVIAKLLEPTKKATGRMVELDFENPPLRPPLTAKQRRRLFDLIRVDLRATT